MGRSEKRKKMRDLLCYAIDVLLENNCIKLDHPGAENQGDEKRGFLQTTLLGKQSVIAWSHVGFEEVQISVWWGYQSKKPITFFNLWDKRYKNAMVRCSGIFERKEGKWLHGCGGENIFRTYCSIVAVGELLNIPMAMPKRFEREGAIL